MTMAFNLLLSVFFQDIFNKLFSFTTCSWSSVTFPSAVISNCFSPSFITFGLVLPSNSVNRSRSWRMTNWSSVRCLSYVPTILDSSVRRDSKNIGTVKKSFKKTLWLFFLVPRVSWSFQCFEVILERWPNILRKGIFRK